MTLWHTIFGALSPIIQQHVWSKSNLSINDPNNEFHEGFFQLPVRVVVPFILWIYVSWVAETITPSLEISDYIVIFIYMIGPTVLLHWKHPLTFVVSVLWVWFPIEWGFLDSHLGELDFGILPVDALMGLFSLIWPLVTTGRHIPWYDWSISKDDLLISNKAMIAISIAVIPLGVLLNFLTFNPDTLLDHEDFSNPVIYAILVFIAIFVVQGLMEETLFRDIIFKHWYYKL